MPARTFWRAFPCQNFFSKTPPWDKRKEAIFAPQTVKRRKPLDFELTNFLHNIGYPAAQFDSDFNTHLPPAEPGEPTVPNNFPDIDIEMSAPASGSNITIGRFGNELREFLNEIRPLMKKSTGEFYSTPTYYNNNRVKSMVLTKKPFYFKGKKFYLHMSKPVFLCPATEQFGGKNEPYYLQARKDNTPEDAAEFKKMYHQYGKRLRWAVKKSVKYRNRRMRKRRYTRRRSYGGGGFRRNFRRAFGGYRRGGYRRSYRRRWY